MEAYPAELKDVPRPLVAALGPNEIQSRILPILRSINEEFMPQVQFKSFGYDHRWLFPPKKEKMSSAVQGIIKSCWLKKHQEGLPSVLLLFYAFEPRLAMRDWAIQETIIRDEVEDLRLDDSPNAAAGTSSMVMNHANNSEERLQSLRKRAELDTKSVWLLKDFVRTSPQLIKLEAAVRTHAIDYYKAQAKRVKKYKKVSPQLAVRHSFKIAHFYEFRKYTSKMLVHYEAAYKALSLLPPQELSNMVVKCAAEYIHFKLIYHTIFSNQNLKVAVDQLQRHMKLFGRATVGRIPYVHWAWVSRQYQVFGQLVLQSQSLGLVNTGGLDSDLYKEAYLYFSAAAKYATQRRKAASHLDLDPKSTPAPLVPSVFVGDEFDNIGRTEAVEKSVPHAAIAIELLGQAISHVEKHLSQRHRLKNRLLLRLGIEHVANQDYGIARHELEAAKGSYLQEHWYAEVSQILQQLLMCVYDDSAAFLDYSLQLLSPKLAAFVDENDRVAAHVGMFQTFDHIASSGKTPPEIELDGLKNVITVDVDFGGKKAFVCEKIQVRVQVESFLPVPIALHSIAIVFDDDMGATYNNVLNHTTSDLSLVPHMPRQYVVDLTLPSMPSKVSCRHVHFTFQNSRGVHWIWTATSFSSRSSLHFETVVPGMGQGAGSPSFQRKRPSMDFSESLLDNQLVVNQPKACATVDLLCNQVLVGEVAPLQFVVHAGQDTLKAPKYTLSIEDKDASFVIVSDAEASLASQDAQSEQTFSVSVQCHAVQDFMLGLQLTYETALGVQVTLETSFAISGVAPFTLATTVHWQNQVARVGEPFNVFGRLTSTAAKVQLLGVRIQDTTSNASISYMHGLQFPPWKMGAGDQHGFYIEMVPTTTSPLHQLGDLVVSWSRLHDDQEESAHVIETTLALPSVAFVSVPISVEVTLPTYGVEGDIASCQLVLQNHTVHMVNVQVKLASESDFLVSGLVDGKVEILPLEKLTCNFGVVPLQPGNLKLPKLELVNCDSKEMLISPDERMALYVVPHGQHL
ncbi:hypothetical protein LEN26_017044 [Aphanomyces euteiches]|nr:hypothetical protein LEN26_017044 [Aphanomyces euteiches]